MDEYLRWDHMENTHYLKQSHHLQEYEESCWWIILNEWKKNKGKPRKLSESEGRKFLQWFPTTLGQKALGPLPGENIESEMNNGTPQSQLMKELEEALAILKLQ